ncbi:hypothetical protein TNCV_4849251 [Trichonephila clavipes]|nr:hypothetical protein TNCV_4849251 [Trichonephila clavipes]
MGCRHLRYTVTPNTDRWHNNSPVVCSCHPLVTCVATNSRALRSHFSTKKCSTTHNKDVTSLPPLIYHPFLDFYIPRFDTNRAYMPMTPIQRHLWCGVVHNGIGLQWNCVLGLTSKFNLSSDDNRVRE